MSEFKILQMFGEILTKQVFDESVERTFKILDGDVKAKKLVEYYKMFEDKEALEIEKIKIICAESIRNTLHNFLWMIEQNEEIMDLVIFDDEKPYSLREISDGLCGELYTEDGWIAKYSQYKDSVE